MVLGYTTRNGPSVVLREVDFDSFATKLSSLGQLHVAAVRPKAGQGKGAEEQGSRLSDR